MQSTILKEFKSHLEVSKKSVSLIAETIETAAKLCIQGLKDGNKIIIFGNGGSAADAQHIAAELVGRYKTERQGLAAIAITTDTSAITAIGNDYGYLRVFDRQIEAIANKGDVVIGISTSGNSKNVVNAIILANKLDCKTIGFSGNSGGEMNKICNINIIVPSNDTPRIQEMHIFIGHTICHLIDQAFEK